MLNNFIVCTAKEACELMGHIDEHDVVVLCVLNKKTNVHKKNRNIEKKEGEELIRKADNIMYQNNDYFGTLSLSGVLRDKNVIHNILFPQLE